MASVQARRVEQPPRPGSPAPRSRPRAGRPRPGSPIPRPTEPFVVVDTGDDATLTSKPVDTNDHVIRENGSQSPALHPADVLALDSRQQSQDSPVLPQDLSTDPDLYESTDDERFLDDTVADERLGDMMSLEAIYSVQKMAEVLISGPDAEREFILFELQQLLDHCPDDTMKILIPVLCEHVPQWTVDLQTKAAERLFDVVSLDLDPHTVKMVTDAAFGVVQASIGKTSPIIANLYNLCGGILVEILPTMNWTPLEISDVIAMVDLHAKQNVENSRKIAARVLGALSNCFDQARVENVVLPRAINLFDDPDVQVRGTVIESLAFIGAALPARVTETEVWPRVERLLDPDEDARIHATAMRTMSHILQHQRDKGANGRLFRELLPPVFNKISGFARRHAPEDQRLVDDDTYLLLEVVSEVFGQFVYSLALFARRSFLKDAYKAYSCMATCNGPLIRRNCAFNLPGVAKALGERFAMELSGLCEFLAKDTDEEVRWILAAGIHQSATLLVPRGNYDRLFSAVCSLLEDENPLVRMNALEHFHELLSAFARDCTDPASIRRLAPVFTNLSMLSEGNWRIQKRLAEQLDKCAEIIPADSLIENVLPLLGQLLEHGTPLVRFASMNATARALRNIPAPGERNDAISRFWVELIKGPFWSRLAMLDGAAAALRIFSSQLFAELFSPTLLQLTHDPVPNVRIKFAKLLAQMSPMCSKLPSYNEAVQKLRHDEDPDVWLVMDGHDQAVAIATVLFRENSAADLARFREEQEFYGYVPRTTKRVRGRLNNIRTGRMLSNHRRQSSDFAEPSSGHLSVSQAVISAAKATSAAASASGRSPSPTPQHQFSSPTNLPHGPMGAPPAVPGTHISNVLRPGSQAARTESAVARPSSPVSGTALPLPRSDSPSPRPRSPLPRPASPSLRSPLPRPRPSSPMHTGQSIGSGSENLHATVGKGDFSGPTSAPSSTVESTVHTPGPNGSQELANMNLGMNDASTLDKSQASVTAEGPPSGSRQISDNACSSGGSKQAQRRREKLRRSFYGRKHSASSGKIANDSAETKSQNSKYIGPGKDLSSTSAPSPMDQPRSLDLSSAASGLHNYNDETMSASSTAQLESVSLSRLPIVRNVNSADAESDLDSKSLGHLPGTNWNRAAGATGKRLSKGPNTVLVVQQQHSGANGLPPMEGRAKSWGGRFVIHARQHSTDGRGRAPNGGNVGTTDVPVKAMRSGSIGRTMAARAKSTMLDGQSPPAKSSNSLLSRKRKQKKQTGSAEVTRGPHSAEEPKNYVVQLGSEQHHSDSQERRSASRSGPFLDSNVGSEGTLQQGPSVRDFVRKLEANYHDSDAADVSSQRSNLRLDDAETSTSPVDDSSPEVNADWLTQSAPSVASATSPPNCNLFASVDNGAMHPKNGSAGPTGPSKKLRQPTITATGRTMSVDERGANKRDIATELGIAEPSSISNVVPVELDPETGLPSFKGNAPWVRKTGNMHVRHPDGQEISLSALASPSSLSSQKIPKRRTPNSHQQVHAIPQKKDVNGHSHSNVPSFHSDTTHVVRNKAALPGSALTTSSVTSPSAANPAGSGGNSRLKLLFGRRKR